MEKIERDKGCVIYEDAEHKFVWLGAGDPAKEKGISTNQYMVVDRDVGYVLDPGGYHVFDRVFNNATALVPVDKIKGLFFSHQDPDVMESLVSWLEANPNLQIFISALWERFVPHLALPVVPKLTLLPDEGTQISLPSGGVLKFIPAPYLHSPGNFHVYDSRAKILFCGDAAAAASDKELPLFVEDFNKHIPLMEGFHRRYLPCNKAVQNYLKRLGGLEINYLCPQHGSIFKGENVGKYVNWLSKLNVGVDA